MMSGRGKGRKGPRKEDFSTQKALKSFLLVNTKTSRNGKNEESQHSRNDTFASFENTIRGSTKRQLESSISSPSSADNSIRRNGKNEESQHSRNDTFASFENTIRGSTKRQLESSISSPSSADNS